MNACSLLSGDLKAVGEASVSAMHMVTLAAGHQKCPTEGIQRGRRYTLIRSNNVHGGLCPALTAQVCLAM
jgi:hypothetical protein